MGAYSYCVKCGSGLDRPSLKEAVAGTMLCPHCEYPRGVDDVERGWVLESIEERLQNLENRLKEKLL